MEDKEYLVSNEIVDLFDEVKASEECRDKALNSIWGSKRAIQFSKNAIKKNREAWHLVYELYPDLIDKTIIYNYKTLKVHIEK